MHFTSKSLIFLFLILFNFHFVYFTFKFNFSFCDTFLFLLLLYLHFKFSVKNFIVWKFCSDTKFLLFSVVINLMSLYFRTFFIVFLKTELLISLKKPFSKSFFGAFFKLLFISIYGFNHAFWFNLISLQTFFKFIYDLMFVLNFLCEEHVQIYHVN